MLPALASSSPATRRRQVVLPHPEGPTSTVNCLSGISSVTLLTATTVPNCLLTCSSNTLAIVRPPAAAQSLHGRPRPASCRHPGGVYDAAAGLPSCPAADQSPGVLPAPGNRTVPGSLTVCPPAAAFMA